MSEYQHYEWQTIDRLLTEKEQEAVSELSSHIEVSSSRAVVTYSWGDFKHDPRDVLVSFFDAHLYMAKWGTLRLMFRFPTGLLNRKGIEPYRVEDRIMFKTVGKFDVLDMDLSEEEGGSWIEGDGSLSGLVSLRNDLLQSDYRSLYLAWLKATSISGDEPPHGRKSPDSRLSIPPVPPGLNRLSPALERFLEQFNVPPCLVAAAAEISPELSERPETDFRPLVAQLAREECDGFLYRVAQGDPSAGLELKKRLHSFVPHLPAAPIVRRSFRELLNRAETIEDERNRRKKEDALKKHVAEMEALAASEDEIWRQVESLIEMKQSKQYDAAVQQLGKLKELSDFRQTQVAFRRRVKALCEQYRRLSGLKYRVDAAKLLLDEPVEHNQEDDS